jgi:hypothetical protein
LIGGEPTLHPEIEKIIRYVKDKGVVCQMLTNGYLLSGSDGDILLEKLIKSGLERILLHIDNGQEAYPDPVKAIHTLLRKIEKYKIYISLSWTIYKGDQNYLIKLIEEFSKYKNLDGILSVLEKNVDDAIKPDYKSSGMPEMWKEYLSLKESLNLHPSIYLPASTDDNKISWLIYLYYINSNTCMTFGISPFLTRIFQRIFRFFSGREIFGKPLMRNAFLFSFIFTCLLEIAVKPGRIKDVFALLKKSAMTKHLRFHYINIQDGPEYDIVNKSISICYHCPDATIRNGKITPVCLADRINPLDKNLVNKSSTASIKEYVYYHLGEK